MEIEFLGHAAFLIRGEKTILIDPFLTGNPSTEKKPSEMKGIDIVLVSHGHGDHLGDAIDIAKNNDAIFVAMYEIANYASTKGVKHTEPMNIGGTINIGPIELSMTNATHSSDFEGGAAHAAGFIVSMEGHTIYHAGDTGVFYGMKLIGELYNPEIAMLPIGSRYTMGVKEAVKAVELIRPSIVIPMHYNTYPLISSENPSDLVRLVGTNAKVAILLPGDLFSI